MNFKQLIRRVSGEEEAVKFFQEYKIIPNVMMCANGHEMKLGFDAHIGWRCCKRSCRTTKGIRLGSWLEGSKIPLETALYFIYCWAHEMTSVKFCHRELEMGHETVTDWNNYMREVCQWRMEQNVVIVGGPGLTVEIDESLFTRRRSRGGRVRPEQWMFGGVCRETKECFIVNVPDRTAATLVPLIRQWVRPGTTVISDNWRDYDRIQKKDSADLEDEDRYKFVDPSKDSRARTVGRMWRGVKFRNERQRGTARDYMDSYLAEYMWRTRLNGRDPFTVMLQDIAEFYPV